MKNMSLQNSTNIVREVNQETIKRMFPKLSQKKNETFFHYLSKAAIACFTHYLYLPEKLHFEHVIPGTHRKRADVYIESGNKRIIHEIQLAQQSIGYTNHRTKIYKVFGNIDNVVWWFWSTDKSNIDFCQENKMDFGIIAGEYKYTDDHVTKFGMSYGHISKEYQYIDDFYNPIGFVSFDLYRHVSFRDFPDGYGKQGFDFIF